MFDFWDGQIGAEKVGDLCRCIGLSPTLALGSDISTRLSIFSDVREVFDLFDFWDGRDGLIGAEKVGDLCRCLGLNPTLALIKKNGGTTKVGQYLSTVSSNSIREFVASRIQKFR